MEPGRRPAEPASSPSSLAARPLPQRPASAWVRGRGWRPRGRATPRPRPTARRHPRLNQLRAARSPWTSHDAGRPGEPGRPRRRRRARERPAGSLNGKDTSAGATIASRTRNVGPSPAIQPCRQAGFGGCGGQCAPCSHPVGSGRDTREHPGWWGSGAAGQLQSLAGQGELRQVRPTAGVGQGPPGRGTGHVGADRTSQDGGERSIGGIRGSGQAVPGCGTGRHGRPQHVQNLWDGRFEGPATPLGASRDAGAVHPSTHPSARSTWACQPTPETVAAWRLTVVPC